MEPSQLTDVHALRQRGRMGEATARCRALVRRSPHDAEAVHLLGLLIHHRGDVTEAADLLERSVRLRPAEARYWRNLAAIRMGSGWTGRAAEAFARVAELEPANAAATRGLSQALLELGKVDEAAACCRRFLEVRPDPAVHSDLLFIQLHDAGASPQSLFEAAREWCGRSIPPRQWPRARDIQGRRMRVGYVSPDFRRHTIARLIAPVLSHHDRSRFEVFCYYASALADDVTARLRGLSEHWRDIAAMNDDQAEELIRRDGIDILVDLTGHMPGNRLTLVARKPAPIQMQLGYAGTSGLEAIDWRITDGDCDPAGASDAFHTEKLVRLSCAWCYERDADAPEPGALPMLQRGHVTFCCLNRAAKFSDDAMAAWAQILHQVDRATLVLLCGDQVGNPWLAARLRKAGIADDRVRLLPRLDYASYLRELAASDIALDPFPYNGDTSTCDALWMGMPVVTLAGDRFAARRGLSILKALRLPELVAVNHDHYVSLAIELAQSPARVAGYRSTLRQLLSRSPLADGVAYTRELEAAYMQMCS